MSTLGVAVLVATLLIALAVGLILQARAGRVRPTLITVEPDQRPTGSRQAAPIDGWRMAGTTAGSSGQVLLLQLSSPVCAPCRQAAALLGELSAGTAGLHHVEIDIADRPDVARTLGVLRTPTVVAFDRGGAELLRVSGVPRVPDLLDALAPALR